MLCIIQLLSADVLQPGPLKEVVTLVVLDPSCHDRIQAPPACWTKSSGSAYTSYAPALPGYVCMGRPGR